MTFKKIALTSAALMISASAAFATNSIVAIGELDEFASTVMIGKVQSEEDGFVRFINMNGDVLGMIPVKEGANSGMPVSLMGVLDNDITAQLFHYGNNMPVAERNINVE